MRPWLALVLAGASLVAHGHGQLDSVPIELQEPFDTPPGSAEQSFRVTDASGRRFTCKFESLEQVSPKLSAELSQWPLFAPEVAVEPPPAPRERSVESAVTDQSITARMGGLAGVCSVFSK
jgi:hypothetical protein